MKNGDGSMHHDDGSMHHSDGSMHHSDSSMHHSDGSMHHSDGSMHHIEGSMHHSDGSMHHSDGSMHHIEGSMHQGESLVGVGYLSNYPEDLGRRHCSAQQTRTRILKPTMLLVGNSLLRNVQHPVANDGSDVTVQQKIGSDTC